MLLKNWIDELITLNDKYYSLNEADKKFCRSAVKRWWDALIHKQDLKSVDLGDYL
jgi:hypothetical protein